MPAAHVPTDGTKKQVSLWSAAGLTQERIAAMLDIDPKTFRKHYKQDYDHGVSDMVKELFTVSFEVAKEKDHKDSSKERQFLLKTRGGFKETSVSETHIKELPNEIKWTIAKPSK